MFARSAASPACLDGRAPSGRCYFKRTRTTCRWLRSPAVTVTGTFNRAERLPLSALTAARGPLTLTVPFRLAPIRFGARILTVNFRPLIRMFRRFGVLTRTAPPLVEIEATCLAFVASRTEFVELIETMAPLGPRGPWGPLPPFAPAGPVAPAGPGVPAGPVVPSAPLGPVAPCGRTPP